MFEILHDKGGGKEYIFFTVQDNGRDEADPEFEGTETTMKSIEYIGKA